MIPEPAMTINGHALTPPEVMTVRIAIEYFALLTKRLGDDPTGRAMTEAYLANIELIRRRIGDPRHEVS